MDNDVNLAALAERHDGAATAADSFAYLCLGAGLGGAICIGDNLVRGDVDAINRLLDSAPSKKRATTIELLTSSVANAALALIASIDPALILLGGPLGTHPALLEPFRQLLARHWPRPVSVQVSTLGERAPLVGATQVALHAARVAAVARVSS